VHLRLDVLRRRHGQLDDPPVHARGPHRVDGRPVDHTSRDRRADARVFRALLRLRRAPLEAVPQLLGGPAAGGSGHQRVAVPAPGHQRDHGVPALHAGAPPSRHPVELVGGQQVRSHRRPQSVAGQHVPAGGLPAHGHPVHVAGPGARLPAGVAVRPVPAGRGVLGHPAAQLVVDLRLGSAPPLVLAVRHVVHRRLWGLGDRDSQPDHLRAGGGLLPVPGEPGSPAAADPPLQLPQRAAAPDHGPGPPARGGRRRGSGHGDRLLLSRPGLGDPQGGREPRLLPSPGGVLVHRRRRAGSQLPHRCRVRAGRPADPPRDAGEGGMSDTLPRDTTLPAAEGVPAPAAPAPRSRRSEFLYFALRNPKLWIGGLVVLFFAVTAVVGPRLTDYGVQEYVGPPASPPSAEHWFGTTTFGQDVFTQFVHGLGASFIVGLLGGGIAAIVGMTVGFVAGYRGGIVDEVLNV